MKTAYTIFIIAMSALCYSQVNSKDVTRLNILDHQSELNLTDEQVTQIKAIQKEYMPKIREARNADLPDKAVIKQLNEERKTRIEQILSTEQLEKWKGIREKIRAEKKDHKP